MSERDKKLLVYLGALLIIAAAYFFVAKPYLDKIDKLNVEKSELSVQLNEKINAISKQEEYKNRIDKSKEDIQKIIDKFPEDTSDEKSIMFVVNTEKDVPIWISNMQFAEDTQGLVSGQESASDAEQAALEEKIAANDETYEASESVSSVETVSNNDIGLDNLIGKTTLLNLTYTTNYSGFKNLLAYVRDYEDRMVISDLSVAFNPEVGTISGNIVLSQYAMLSPDRVLAEIETEVDRLGTSNIFSTRAYGDGEFSVDSMNINNSQTLETEDYYVKLSPVTDNTHGITVGRADDIMESTSIVSDFNDNQDVYFELKGNEGIYKLEYRVGNEMFTDDLQKASGEHLWLRIISTRRNGDGDDVGMKLHITNESDIPIVIGIEGEDPSKPRVNIVEKNGEVAINE